MQDEFIERLREHDLKVTRPRLAVLEVLHDHAHADASTIANAVRQRIGRVSTQTIYDVLHALADIGVIRAVEPAGSAARYDLRVGDNHHHMVCRSCQVMVDVDCAIGAAPCLTPETNAGFIIDEAEVTYWGLCPACHNT